MTGRSSAEDRDVADAVLGTVTDAGVEAEDYDEFEALEADDEDFTDADPDAADADDDDLDDDDLDDDDLEPESLDGGDGLDDFDLDDDDDEAETGRLPVVVVAEVEEIAAAVVDDVDDDDDTLREGEFVCRSCFMAKRDSALADPDRMLCRDCV
jgi:hypothetical protein